MKTNSRWIGMACSSLGAFLSVCFFVIFLGGCEGPVDLHCYKNNDCIEGYLCNSEKKCVKSDTPDTPDLAFVTPTVKTAIIGGDYTDPPAQLIEVQGGLSPKTWALKIDDNNMGYLDWLDIDPNSGLLRNVQGKTPGTVVSNAEFGVDVTDSSNMGKGLTISKTYTMAIEECVGPMPCYTNKSDPADAGICFVGTRQCVAEKLLDCVPGNQKSTDPYNCGSIGNSSCGSCSPNEADACVGGVCQCSGSGRLCDPSTSEYCCNKKCVDVINGGDTNNCGKCGNICTGTPPGCCKGTCVDLSSSAEHCGDCNINCLVANASKSTCGGSACNYVCDNYWDNCSGNPNNICVTDLKTDANNCGACGIVCNSYGTSNSQTASCENGACKCLIDNDCGNLSKCLSGECRCGDTLLPCPINNDQYKYCVKYGIAYYCCPVNSYDKSKCDDSCTANGNQWCSTNNKCCKTCPDIGCL